MKFLNKLSKKEKKEGKEEDKKNKKSSEGVWRKDLFGNFSDLLIKPLASEKAKSLQAFNKYVFEISQKAKKRQIKEAIKALFDVEPIKVNIIKVKGKIRKFKRSRGKTKAWRKTIITLKQGETIKELEK